MNKKQKTILAVFIGAYAALFVITWITCGFLASVILCAFCLMLPFALKPMTVKELLFMIWLDTKK